MNKSNHFNSPSGHFVSLHILQQKFCTVDSRLQLLLSSKKKASKALYVLCLPFLEKIELKIKKKLLMKITHVYTQVVQFHTKYVDVLKYLN